MLDAAELALSRAQEALAKAADPVLLARPDAAGDVARKFAAARKRVEDAEAKWMDAASAHEAGRDRLEAAQRFEAALEIDPSNERAARELADMRRQATNERKGLLSRLMGKKE